MGVEAISAAHALAALTRRIDSIVDGKNTQQRSNDDGGGADSDKENRSSKKRS